jgi:hypothetical protein
MEITMRRRPPTHFAYPTVGVTVVADTDEYAVEALGGGIYRVTIDRDGDIVAMTGTKADLRARLDRDAKQAIRAAIKAALA